MRVVYKYALPAGPVQDIEMPAGAIVLTVQSQRDEPFIWAEVDPDAPKFFRRFRTYPTGSPMDEGSPMQDWKKYPYYVGTFQLNDGALVFHVYTDGEERP